MISYITNGKSNEESDIIDVSHNLHSFNLFGNQCKIIEKLCNYQPDIIAALKIMSTNFITLTEETIKKGYHFFVDAEEQSI